MSTLVFQVVIKQWDKSLRSDNDAAARDSVASTYPIQAEPKFSVFDHPCIIDQHSIDFATDQPDKNINRLLKKKKLVDGSIQLERFILSKSPGNSQLLNISYQQEDKEIIDVGNLTTESGWLQAKYNWRYSVEKNNQIFWQYEELILNLALATTLENNYFLNSEPTVIFYPIKNSH
jgi:hypothetical protein